MYDYFIELIPVKIANFASNGKTNILVTQSFVFGKFCVILFVLQNKIEFHLEILVKYIRKCNNAQCKDPYIMRYKENKE